MEETNHSSLEDEALKRKERLKNLKRKIEVIKDDDQQEASDKTIRPKFRSYRPLDKTLNEKDDSEKKQVNDDIEEQIQDQLELLKTPITIDEIDITNLAPRKQDWDLKRDISKKLEKLEWLTQKAIAELIRERLKMNQENIFQAVNIATVDTNTKEKIED